MATTGLIKTVRTWSVTSLQHLRRNGLPVTWTVPSVKNPHLYLEIFGWSEFSLGGRGNDEPRLAKPKATLIVF